MLRRNLLVLVAVIVTCGALSSGAGAYSSPLLTIKAGQKYIATYEHNYWRKTKAKIQVRSCKQENPRQVSCIVEIDKYRVSLFLRDWATLLPQHIIRVHPSSEYEEISEL